jgi:hypothetical protein
MHRQLFIGLLGLTVALSLVSAARAAEFAQGDQEIQVSAGLFTANGSDTGTANGELSWGKFMTDQWQYGVLQSINYEFIERADDIWTASTVGFINYHFRTEHEKFKPFAGAFIGAVYNEDDAEGTIGPALGFKYFLSDNTYLVTRYRFEWFFDDLDLGDIDRIDEEIGDVFEEDVRSDGNHVLTLGFGYRF